MDAERPPLPPFTNEADAALKVRLAEDAWNTRDPERVSLGYTVDSHWRNRTEFLQGQTEAGLRYDDLQYQPDDHETVQETSAAQPELYARIPELRRSALGQHPGRRGV